jgi:outer membrane protein assembly factor BamA
VRGLDEPPDLTAAVRGARFAEEALERGRERLLQVAHERGFPRAAVHPEIEERPPGAAALVFRVELGAPLAVVETAFPGAKVVSAKRLLEVAGGAPGLMTEPEAARKRLLAEYRRVHHLAAQVAVPRVEPAGDHSVRIVTAVEEGPAALLVDVRFEGANVPPEELRGIAQLQLGGAYDESELGPAVQRLRDFYLKRGYGGVRVTPQLVAAGPDLELVFEVLEGRRRSVGSVRVEGLRRTRASLVRGQIELKPGEPLDPRRLVALEKRLLDLGMFSRVTANASEDEPAEVVVQVEEQGPYVVAYNARWNDQDQFTGLLDGEIGNLLGRGLALGGHFEAGADLRDTRFSLHLPALGKAGDFTATVHHRRDDSGLVDEQGRELPAELQARLIEQGLELQQTLHLRSNWDFLYGYRFRRVQRERPQLVVDVGGVSLSVLRERRNDPINARRGSFLSLSVDLAPRAAGSDVSFYKVFTQVFLNHELSPSFTWSHAYRFGFADGLNESRLREVDLGRTTEFFRAGGATSIRGYANDSVGPPRPSSRFSAGGEALLVLNQELRYRHPSGLGAVVFWDAGNAFLTAKDLDLELRHAIGTGLRYESPVGLLRVDVGFPLNRRPQDKAFRVFFSLGQAF